MKAIPRALRQQLANDTRMKVCARANEGGCDGPITWQHCYGRENQEAWQIIPLCWRMHLGDLKNKQKDKWVALNQASETDFDKYPKKAVAWRQEKTYLNSIYGG